MTRILTNPNDVFATEPGGLGRRNLLKGAAALAASTVLASEASARDFGANAEPQRYPDPDIIAIDPKRFKAKVGNTSIKRLDRKSTRLNSSHITPSRMPSSA